MDIFEIHQLGPVCNFFEGADLVRRLPNMVSRRDEKGKAIFSAVSRVYDPEPKQLKTRELGDLLVVDKIGNPKVKTDLFDLYNCIILMNYNALLSVLDPALQADLVALRMTPRRAIH